MRLLLRRATVLTLTISLVLRERLSGTGSLAGLQSVHVEQTGRLYVAEPNVKRMMLIRVPLQSIAAVAAAVPPSASHRMLAYIDTDTVDKTSSSAVAAAASSIKVSLSSALNTVLARLHNNVTDDNWKHI